MIPCICDLKVECIRKILVYLSTSKIRVQVRNNQNVRVKNTIERTMNQSLDS